MRLMLVRGSKNTAITDIKIERSQINMKTQMKIDESFKLVGILILNDITYLKCECVHISLA